jgi:hypothetical protein
MHLWRLEHPWRGMAGDRLCAWIVGTAMRMGHLRMRWHAARAWRDPASGRPVVHGMAGCQAWQAGRQVIDRAWIVGVLCIVCMRWHAGHVAHEDPASASPIWHGRRLAIDRAWTWACAWARGPSLHARLSSRTWRVVRGRRDEASEEQPRKCQHAGLKDDEEVPADDACGVRAGALHHTPCIAAVQPVNHAWLRARVLLHPFGKAAVSLDLRRPPPRPGPTPGAECTSTINRLNCHGMPDQPT